MDCIHIQPDKKMYVSSPFSDLEKDILASFEKMSVDVGIVWKNIYINIISPKLMHPF